MERSPTSSAGDACVDDFDCEKGLLCYRGSDEVIGLSENRTTACGCDTWSGLSGNECEEWSLNSHLLLALFGLLLVLTLRVLAMNVWLLTRLVRTPKLRKWTTQSISLMLIQISLLGLLLWYGSRACTVFYPNSPSRFISSHKLNRAVIGEKVGIFMACCFMLLATLTLSMRWIDLAHTSAQMVSIDSSLWGKQRRKIVGLQLIFLVVVTIGAFTGCVELAVLACTPLCLIIFGSYVYAWFKLKNILDLLVLRPGISSSSDITADNDDEEEAKKGQPSPARPVAGWICRFTKQKIQLGSNLNPDAMYYHLLLRVRRTVTLVVVGGVAYILIGVASVSIYGLIGFRELCPLNLDGPPGLCSMAYLHVIPSATILFLNWVVQHNIYEDTLAHLVLPPQRSTIDTTLSHHLSSSTFQ